MKKYDDFYFLEDLTFYMDQELLTSPLWCISIWIIVIIVGRISFLVSGSISKTEKNLWVKLFLICYHCQMKAVLISPFSPLGNYTYLSFCVKRNCHLRAISVPMLAYFFCLHSFFSHMGIFLSVWVYSLSMHKWQHLLLLLLS